MLHTAELTAIAQANRTTVEDLCDTLYRGLEVNSPVVEGMIWEARIVYTDAEDFDGWPGGHILAAEKFGTLLAELHVRGFLTGEHAPDERLASVRRVRA